MKRIRRIMHATDFSPASRAAFTQAVELARVTGAELILAHALSFVPPYLGGEAYMSPSTWDRIEASARSTARRRLDALIGRARKAGVRARALVIVGSPYEQIARAAGSARAEMLVVGTHGRTGLPRLLVGSVAQRILATARCPVLLVRPR